MILLSWIFLRGGPVGDDGDTIGFAGVVHGSLWPDRVVLCKDRRRIGDDFGSVIGRTTSFRTRVAVSLVTMMVLILPDGGSPSLGNYNGVSELGFDWILFGRIGLGVSWFFRCGLLDLISLGLAECGFGHLVFSWAGQSIWISAMGILADWLGFTLDTLPEGLRLY